MWKEHAYILHFIEILAYLILASIDDSCLNQSLLWGLQINGFPLPTTHLPVGIWLSIIIKNFPFFLNLPVSIFLIGINDSYFLSSF